MQLSLELPYTEGWCEAHRFKPECWPQYIRDKAGKEWLVLHVGGSPYADSKPVRFCCHTTKEVCYHYLKDTEAFHA